MKAVQASRRYAVRPVPLAFLRGYVGVAVSVEAMRRLKVFSSVQTNLDTAWHFLNLAPILHLSHLPLVYFYYFYRKRWQRYLRRSGAAKQKVRLSYHTYY